MWSKKLPYKMSFTLWTAWKFRLPSDDAIMNIGINMASRCYCCTSLGVENITHVFLTSPTAEKLWRLFAHCAGINCKGLQLYQMIIKWWTHQCSTKLKQVIKAVPSIILLEIWKRRNIMKHGGRVSFEKLVHQINTSICKLIRSRFPKMKQVPLQWPEMVTFLENYKPVIYHRIVQWKPPPTGTIKRNSDGASRGNPGKSSYGFCLRNHTGDLVFPQAEVIPDTTDTEAEVVSIRDALAYCVAEGVTNCILDIDSLLMKKALEGKWATPWHISTIIDDARELMEFCATQVEHTYRKGNIVADYSANLAMEESVKMGFRSFSELPK